MSAPILDWAFPLPRPHTGVLLGNGVQGLLIWGNDTLKLTVGRAGFWDHRGGNAFTSRITYQALRALLEANDEPGLRQAFAPTNTPAGLFPHQIGGGRLELRFPHGLRPSTARLDTGNGLLTITLRNPQGKLAQVQIRQAMDAELAWIELGDLGHVDVLLLPSWHYVGPQLSALGCAPPERWGNAAGGGFCQYLPEDDPLALAWHRRGGTLVLATALGPDARRTAETRVAEADLAQAARRADAWWAAYRADLPRVELPDAGLQHSWDYGVYKLAGLTTPGGVAATLQGPWIEEYQLPPWSCDYHFNVNIQMIYWPCLVTGRFAHLQPLWELLAGWMPQLQANGRAFFGADDAMLMPHAVDDRCAAVGAFWTGMIDQGCAAWMAQLAWLHASYSGDRQILREVAWPLLTGAFAGYWAMLEPRDGRLSLPVSVSPEYHGASMHAWGRDASFQLAALHMLARVLPEAAAWLGAPVDPRWERARNEVPPYSRVPVAPPPRDGPDAPPRWRIALWEGQDLAESHRHHSHLAAIYPFATLDPADPAEQPTIMESMRHWVAMGAGNWTGWCMPWAATLCARVGWADAALAWLHWWRWAFTNEGHGTLHDAAFPGVSSFSATVPNWRHDPDTTREVMQIEAGMGVLTAIAELLVQCRNGEIVVLPQLPQRWRDLRFDGLWTEGGFRIGATVVEGQLREVRVTATRDGTLRLRHGIAGPWQSGAQRDAQPFLHTTMRAGEQLTVRQEV